MAVIFRRRNNNYYVTLLAYVVFAVIYILVTGTITNDTVEFGFRDPVVYIIGIFILYTLIMLTANLVRNPQLILEDDRIVFRTRFRERVIPHAQIQQVLLKRERRRFNDGTFAVVLLRLHHHRRQIRIRVARYEQETQLYEAFKRIAERMQEKKGSRSSLS